MVKTYLKYEIVDILGQITGKQCPPAIDASDSYIYCGSNDYVIKINLRTGLVERRIAEPKIKSIVSCIYISDDQLHLFVGYENGNIAVYSREDDYNLTKLFKLHKSEITCLSLKDNFLASGSKDTNIYIWDIIGDSVLYKLSGHKDIITNITFTKIRLNEIEEADVLVSSSKDNSLKIWNFKVQECLQTVSDLVHKISDFIIFENMIILGSFDNKLKIYSFETTEREDGITTYLESKGTLLRQSSAKIISMKITNDKKLLSILSKDSSIEFFKCLSNAEVKRRLINEELKLKKMQKKEKLLNKEKIVECSNKVKELVKTGNFNYKMKFFPMFKFFNDSNITGIAFMGNSKKSTAYNFAISLKNNSIECYELLTKLINDNIYKEFEFGEELEVKVSEENLEINKTLVISSYGHREAIKLVKFGDKSDLIFTACSDSVKIWNLFLKNAVKTIEIERVVSGCFLIQDKYLALGTKNGGLYLYDTMSLECVQGESSAHGGEINSIYPFKYSYIDEKYKIVTCSSDKQIKYWNLNFGKSKGNFQRQKNLIVENMSLYKTLDAVDQVTHCMISPDMKFIVYSLLDNSIRIFYEDTNKFYLSLYGHKLPVLSFDISSDGNLLVSGSSDKNVRIWGMDFGDCHKSIFAHGDAITCVRFVKDTHYFFSCSKDKVIRYWDADSYEMILEFDDFFMEVWSLDINKEGTMMVGVSSDRSIRVYEITKEQIIIEAEKEKRLEKQIEKDFEKEFDEKANAKETEKMFPVRRSLENLTYSEDIMDSLEKAEKFREEVYQYEISLIEWNKSKKMYETNKIKDLKVFNLEKPEKPKPNLFFLGKNIFKFILEKLKSIPFADLENTLNNLPYSVVQTLFFYLEYYIRNNIEIELAHRCVVFITTLFESQISNDKTVIRLLSSIKKHMRKNLSLVKEILNFNIHSINTILLAKKDKMKSIEEYKNSAQGLDMNFAFS